MAREKRQSTGVARVRRQSREWRKKAETIYGSSERERRQSTAVTRQRRQSTGEARERRQSTGVARERGDNPREQRETGDNPREKREREETIHGSSERRRQSTGEARERRQFTGEARDRRSTAVPRERESRPMRGTGTERPLRRPLPGRGDGQLVRNACSRGCNVRSRTSLPCGFGTGLGAVGVVGFAAGLGARWSRGLGGAYTTGPPSVPLPSTLTARDPAEPASATEEETQKSNTDLTHLASGRPPANHSENLFSHRAPASINPRIEKSQTYR